MTFVVYRFCTVLFYSSVLGMLETDGGRDEVKMAIKELEDFQLGTSRETEFRVA